MNRAQRVVHQILDAFNPDDPELFVKSQPGFQFRITSYEGEQVFVCGTNDGETETYWPWPIGNVVEGPEPLPPYRRQRWYAFKIDRVHDIEKYGLGLRYYAGLRTFDTKEEAAMAIWRIWSQLPKRKP